jgi:hypothetical protein
MIDDACSRVSARGLADHHEPLRQELLGDRAVLASDLRFWKARRAR